MIPYNQKSFCRIEVGCLVVDFSTDKVESVKLVLMFVNVTLILSMQNLLICMYIFHTQLYMVERVVPKLQVMEFMGNFYDDVQILTQVMVYMCNYVLFV